MFGDIELPLLGYGMMRLPTKDGHVDREETQRLVDHAFAGGVRYFDTAYSYHNGESELATGEALSKYSRDSFYLASKFPGHEIRKSLDPAFIFEDQLRKCGVEYFDFYLLHNVNEFSLKNYDNPDLGIIEYFKEQKANGRIKHLGFSSHARPETLEKFVDDNKGLFEFCQIQLNYLDWRLQDAKRKYDLLTERGIAVWVMEPVRGGKLVTLSDDYTKNMKLLRPDESVAAWAFRWLQQLDNVHMILSGMTAMDQLVDNLKTFEQDKPLNEGENALLDEIAVSMSDMIPCTACRYCCRSCPQELDIPMLLSMYSDCRYELSTSVSVQLDAMDKSKHPSACIACGNCKSVCPQGIDVPDYLAKFAEIQKKLPDWAAISAAREAAQSKPIGK